MLKEMKYKYYFAKCRFYLMLSGANIAVLKVLQNLQEFLNDRIKRNIDIINGFMESES